MKRREFIAASAALLVSPRRSRAQGGLGELVSSCARADEPARDPVHAASQALKELDELVKSLKEN